MSENDRENSLAHIDFLIEPETRDKLGITDRELDTQVLRLCGGFNDLQAKLEEVEKKLVRANRLITGQIGIDTMLEVAEARIAKLEGAMRKYGQHTDSCPARPSAERQLACKCGFTEALAQ